MRKKLHQKRKKRIRNENRKDVIETFFFRTCTSYDVCDLSFSAQTGEVSGDLSYKISYKIVETKNELFNENKSPEELSCAADGIHYYVRKAAHMTEYFLLAVAISFPLYVYGVRGIWLMILAGIVCVGFAGLDEYHQSFVDSRTPSVKDVGIDSIGAMIGVLLVQAFCWSALNSPVKKKKKKTKNKKLRYFLHHSERM